MITQLPRPVVQTRSASSWKPFPDSAPKEGSVTLYDFHDYALEFFLAAVKDFDTYFTDEEKRRKRIDRFVDNTLALCKVNKERDAIAIVMDYLDDLLIDREDPECELAFRKLSSNIDGLLPAVMASALCISMGANHIPARACFYEKSLRQLTRMRGKKYASELLGRYR